MPPLGSHPYKPSVESVSETDTSAEDLAEKNAERRKATYFRMIELVRREKFRVTDQEFIGQTTYQTPKAIYRTKGQPKNEFTRAWVSYGPFENAHLHTEAVRKSHNLTVDPVEGGEMRHFWISPNRAPLAPYEINGSHFHSSYYDRLSEEQMPDFWDQVKDTLDLIERVADSKCLNDPSRSIPEPSTIESARVEV
jgi:hypothetical protein